MDPRQLPDDERAVWLAAFGAAYVANAHHFVVHRRAPATGDGRTPRGLHVGGDGLTGRQRVANIAAANARSAVLTYREAADHTFMPIKGEVPK